MELGNIKQLWKKIEEITKAPTMLRKGTHNVEKWLIHSTMKKGTRRPDSQWGTLTTFKEAKICPCKWKTTYANNQGNAATA